MRPMPKPVLDTLGNLPETHKLYGGCFHQRGALRRAVTDCARFPGLFKRRGHSTGVPNRTCG